ncbi:DNA-directed RNA polymerase III subunit RPC2 [Datura stramonium]|uniref:DNA-directed RNA polymerase n=1 Tax=Datura stramonium TaxID=4076 RepID=A0ABS8SC95_DATST|nr:DNA-directed RNA polymerase III subunit RPC2 [Datura stramonium]
MGYDSTMSNDQSDHGIDKQHLASPIKNLVDKYQLVPEFLKVRGLVKQHLDSFNYFVKTDIKKIVRANQEIRSILDPNIYLRYRDVHIGEPSMIFDAVTEKLCPQKCRLSDLTYAAPIYVCRLHNGKSWADISVNKKNFVVLCPCDTPGVTCGLVKNLALMTHVTTDEDERPIMSLVHSLLFMFLPPVLCLGVEDLEQLSAEELHMPTISHHIKWTYSRQAQSPQRFAIAMRKLRRAGKIGEFVSIFVEMKQRCVYIASEMVGAVFVVRLSLPQTKDELCAKADSFLKDGLIEYLDVNERTTHWSIALYEKEATPETTHIEIGPFTILINVPV